MSLFRAGSGIWRVAASGVAAHAAGGAWWEVAGQTCVAAYQPKGAADIAASYVNLANPGTYNAAPGVAPTWASATGWTFNGTTQYLTTGVVPSADNTWSMLCQLSNGDMTATRDLIGCYPNPVTNRFYIRSWHSATEMIYGIGSTARFTSPSMTSGICAIGGLQGYRNGVADGAPGVAGSGSFPQVLVGCANYGGVPVNFYSGNIQAIAIWDTTLTAAQVAAISAACAALTG